MSLYKINKKKDSLFLQDWWTDNKHKKETDGYRNNK